MEKSRCPWCVKPLDVEYHDAEWGVPLHDDRMLFETLQLECAQAGLSWSSILAKREGYRTAFHGFDVDRVAQMSDEECEEILRTGNVVRNRLKVFGTVKNARHYKSIQGEFGSFDAYLWNWVEGVPIVNAWKETGQVPAETELSQRISRDLKRRGFTFVGPTICYAYLQAVGVVNDHLVTCYRFAELTR